MVRSMSRDVDSRGGEHFGEGSAGVRVTIILFQQSGQDQDGQSGNAVPQIPVFWDMWQPSLVSKIDPGGAGEAMEWRRDLWRVASPAVCVCVCGEEEVQSCHLALTSWDFCRCQMFSC